MERARLGFDARWRRSDPHRSPPAARPQRVGGFREMNRLGYRVRNPELIFATPDHAISSEPGRDTDPSATGARYVRVLREECLARGIRMFDLGQDGQGIVHVIGPELGLSLPGPTIVVGVSHT